MFLTLLGVLGDGTTAARTVPVLVGKAHIGNRTITTLQMGLYHAAVLTDTSNVYSWGDNSQGQLGDATSSMFSYQLF